MSTIATIAAAPVLAAIAIEDLRHHRIRNHYVLALAAVTAAAVMVEALDGDSAVVGRAVLGAAVGFAPLAVARITQPGRMGGGDLKLGAGVGALVGTVNPWLALVVVGLGLVGTLVPALVSRRQQVPLAPAITAAAVLAIAMHAAL